MKFLPYPETLRQWGRVGGSGAEAEKSRPVAANENPPFTAFLAYVFISMCAELGPFKVQTKPFQNLDKNISKVMSK